MVGQTRRDTDDMAAPELFHRRYGGLRDVVKSVDVGRHNVGILLGAVVGEWTRNENTGVIDQRVDPPEIFNCRRNHARASFRIADVARDGQQVRIARRLDRARRGDDAIIAIEIGADERRADPLRCAGDNDDFLTVAHDD